MLHPLLANHLNKKAAQQISLKTDCLSPARRDETYDFGMFLIGLQMSNSCK